jgi:hypothetical protein
MVAPEVPRERLLLGAILVVAVAVRTVGLDFGTPLLHCRPDERTILNLVLRFGSGDLNPHFFNYGSLWLYVLAAAYGAYFALGWVVGWFSSPRDLLHLYDFEPTSLVLIARSLSVAMGTASVFFAAQAGRALLGRTEGLLAGALLSLTYLHVRDSHFATTDVPMTAFLTASLFFLARTLRSGALRDLALAGLCAGLATSTKYAGVLLFVPAAWTYLCRVREEGASLAPDRRALAFAALFALGFFGGTPFAALDAPSFVAGVLAESRHLSEGHHVDLPPGIVQHVRVSLLYGMGAPLLAASVLGAVVLALRRPREAGLLLGFPLAYFVLLVPAQTVFVRYALPLLPFLCVAAAFGLAELARALAARSPVRAPAWSALLCAAVLAPGALRIVQLDALLGERDNRLIVQEWIETHLPAGSTLHQAVPGELFKGPQWARIDLFPTAELLERDFALLGARGVAERRMRVLIEELRASGAPGFVEVGFEPEVARFVSLLGEPVSAPRYVLLARHPVRRLPPPPAALLGLLERDYALLQSFVVAPLEPTQAVYDEQDAFFVPFAGFEGVERPGPSYFLYERRPDTG